MYQRGDLVVVSGHGGRRATLRVWEDRGRGVALSTDAGYARLLRGDTEAPVVGFPREDVLGRAGETSPLSPSDPQQPSEQSPGSVQD